MSPAREIEGTWATTFPTPFKIKTDFCSELLEDVATEERMLTMIITSTNYFQVDIELHMESSNYQVLDEACDPTGYVPDLPLDFLIGNLSSTQMEVNSADGRRLGVFNFTTDLMEGSWGDLWCQVYCQNVYTESNAIKLIRQ